MGANDFEGSDGGPLPVTAGNTRCPSCNGDGGGMAHINRGNKPHTFEWVACSICSGDGVVSDERAALIAEGKKLREARLARDESLLEMATRLNMSPAELSGIEVGRAHPLAYEGLRKRLAN